MRRQPYPWQQATWQVLCEAARQEQLPHAILLRGVSGLGKRDFAHAFAAFVLCHARGDVACGTCRACLQWAAGSHPNFYLLEAPEGKNHVSVQSVRDMTGWLQQTGHANTYKIVLLDSADLLNQAAFNALLKTLEEPPGLCCLLLLDHQKNPLPATVLSRVASYPMAMTDADLASEWLASVLGEVAFDRKAILAAVDYAPLRLVHEDISAWLGLRDRLIKTLAQLWEGSLSIMTLSERMLKLDLKVILGLWQSLCRDTWVLLLGGDATLLHPDVKASLSKIATFLDVGFMCDFTKQLQRASFLLQSDAHPNQALLLQALLLQWQKRECQVPFFAE